MAAPGIVTARIFSFILCWSVFMFALILSRGEAVTLAGGLALFNDERGVQWHGRAAACLLILVRMCVLALSGA